MRAGKLFEDDRKLSSREKGTRPPRQPHEKRRGQPRSNRQQLPCECFCEDCTRQAWAKRVCYECLKKVCNKCWSTQYEECHFCANRREDEVVDLPLREPQPQQNDGDDGANDGDDGATGSWQESSWWPW